VKLGGTKAINFDATFSNVFNQHRVVAIWQEIDSDYTASNYIKPGGMNIAAGLNFYSAAMAPYDYTALMNSRHGAGKPITVDSLYGQPDFYQQSRNIRLGLHFTF
jgi:hypothetical protein